MLDKEKWLEEFLASDRLNLISREIEKIHYDTQVFFSGEQVIGTDTMITVREIEFAMRRIDLQPFFILDYISKNTNSTIYDIGCGANFFKRFYNIVGIDPVHPKADIRDIFDDDYALYHKEDHDNVIAINSIHFCSIDLIEKQLNNFFNLAKKDGFAYAGLNFQRIKEHTLRKTYATDDETKKWHHLVNDLDLAVTFINDIVNRINHDLLYFYEKVKETNDGDFINGNINILIKRK